MKITELALTNFGLWAKQGIAFDRPINLVFGVNASGKTTWCRAIEMLLTGDCHAFRGHRLGTRALIGPAAKTSTVTGTLQVGERRLVVRRRTLADGGLSTDINDHAATKAVDDYFSPSGMRNPAGAWRSACNVGRLLDLDEAGQKALLLDLVDPAIPEALLAPLRADAEGRLPRLPATLEDLPKVYQEAYDGRTAAKKKLAGLRVPARPDLPAQPLEEIRAKLDGLRAEEHQLIALQGEAAGQRAERARQIAALEVKRDKVVIRLGELGPATPVERQLAESDKVLAAARKETEAAEARQVARRPKEERLRAFRQWATDLGKLGATCVISGEIVCPLPKNKRDEHADAFQRSIRAIEKELGKNGETTTPILGPIEAKASGLRKALQQIRDLTEERDRLVGEIATLGAGLPPEDAQEEALVALRARLTRGDQALAQAAEINRAWAELEKATTWQKALAEDVAALERLCLALGPKGLGERLLGERLGDVAERMNATLRTFGLAVAFAADPWAVTFNGRPALLLSASERWRAGCAFQVAVAALTGAHFLVLDGADILDRANRATLLDVLLQAVAAGAVEQAVVTSTLTVPLETLLAGPWPDSVALWLAGEGGLKRVGS